MGKDKDISDKDLEDVAGGRKTGGGPRKGGVGGVPDFGVEDILGSEEKKCSCSCNCSSSGSWTCNSGHVANGEKDSAKSG